MCSVLDDTRYTGYDEHGYYCEAASPALDDAAHLLLHSGRLGIVVDAGGLKAPASSGNRNLFPRLGATSGAEATPRAVSNAFDATQTAITLDIVCEESNDSSYTLGTADGDFVQVGLVRQVTLHTPFTLHTAHRDAGHSLHTPPPLVQGHTVTQVTLTNLQFEGMDGTIYGPCASFVPKRGERGICRTDFGAPTYTRPCPTSRNPQCVGFVPGQKFGDCWSVCRAGGHPNLWGELSVWGDLITFELAWDAAFHLDTGCTGTITAAIGAHSSTAALASSGTTGGGRVSLVLTPDSGSLATAQASAHPVEVTSEAGQVLSRAATHDVFIEVPRNTPTCGYNGACASVPLKLVDMTATNPHPTEFQATRLSFSRNFETRADLSQSRTGAEITGLSVQIWETSTGQPTGLAAQISKNWHRGSTDAYWAGFDGFWWTASMLLRLPPNSSIALSLALSYEQYGGVPAWSHAQLSIVGYSDKWLWEQAALGTGGENICTH